MAEEKPLQQEIIGAAAGMLSACDQLLAFDGDLYGQRVRVEFHRRLRDEVRFDSLDALKNQITQDAATRAYFEK